MVAVGLTAWLPLAGRPVTISALSFTRRAMFVAVPVTVQLSWVLSPTVMAAGEALKLVMRGAGVTATVTSATTSEPPVQLATSS